MTTTTKTKTEADAKAESVKKELEKIKCPPSLVHMLRFRRPAWTSTENAFIRKFIDPLGAHEDGIGNRWVIVGENPNILFSSHTDTVHYSEGYQSIEVGADGWIGTADGATECLGADCTAGVWVMVEMIKAKVPGVYVFHRAEEIGCVGSKYVAQYEPYLLTGIDAAIAFDRRGFTSIITRQTTGKCCSDEFATSLGEALLGKGQTHFKADTGGTFTDTAQYIKLVPECTNLSIGYQGAHQPSEILFYPYLVHLLELLIKADWSKLVIKRDPKEVVSYAPSYGAGHFSHRSSFGGVTSTVTTGKHYKNSSSKGQGNYGTEDDPFGDRDYDNSGSDVTKLRDLEEIIRLRPDMVAEALLELGISADDLVNAQLDYELQHYYGTSIR